MESADINWIAVVVAAAISMVLGALWYSPLLFARPWMAAVGRTMEEMSMGARGYVISAVGALLAATTLGYIVDWAEADELIDGIFVGGSVWLGFVATTLAVNTYFGGRPLRLWLIDNGYQLLSLAVMGAVVAVWD
jgi:hypothetical protein